jgi:hypothetical protein
VIGRHRYRRLRLSSLIDCVGLKGGSLIGLRSFNRHSIDLSSFKPLFRKRNICARFDYFLILSDGRIRIVRLQFDGVGIVRRIGTRPPFLRLTPPSAAVLRERFAGQKENLSGCDLFVVHVRRGHNIRWSSVRRRSVQIGSVLGIRESLAPGPPPSSPPAAAISAVAILLRCRLCTAHLHRQGSDNWILCSVVRLLQQRGKHGEVSSTGSSSAISSNSMGAAKAGIASGRE